jgi:hypothetical protein
MATKRSTIYSNNPKMNTAPMPELPGYAKGGMVYGDPMMELMERRPESITEALVREAAFEKQRQDAVDTALKRKKV